MLETLNQSSRPGEWVNVPKGNVMYSSVLGSPIAGLPADKNSSFDLSTYYYNTQCPQLRYANNTGDWLSSLNIPFTSSHNTSTIWDTEHQNRKSFFLGSYTNATGSRSNGSDTSPVHLIFLSRSSNNITAQDVQRRAAKVTVADCFMTATYVDSNVQCNVKDCRVDKMRNSTSPPLRR